jgi:ABC-2 type transport system ATP-binding protein
MRASSALSIGKMSAAADELHAAVEVSGLAFNYGSRRALGDVSFSIKSGEIFGFLGPNGGGKTTLFRLLSTLVPIQAGSVRVFGVDLKDCAREVRARLGVVFQKPSVDGKLTVLENLEHHGHLYGISGSRLRSRCDAMLDRLGLKDRADDLVETLSGGLQRRTELAKALLHQPQLLLLDEPSTGLDPAARRDFINYLAHLRQSEGVTIVLTTHYMEEAERCDRIGVIDEGRIVAIAPPAELKNQLGSDLLVISTPSPEGLQAKIASRFQLKASIVEGLIRIEHARAHEIVGAIVEVFGPEIESITYGKPTLEDVFIHLTGHRFQSGASESR